MARIVDVAVREFRTTVLTKAFLLAAVVLPAVVWGLALALPLLLHAKPKPLVGHVAVIDGTLSADERGMQPFLAAEFDAERARTERDRRTAELKRLLEGTLPPQLRDVMQGQLERALETPLPDVQLEVSGDSAGFEALKARVRDGELLCLAVIEPPLLSLERESNRFDLYLREGLTRQQVEELTDALQRAAVAARAAREGLDIERARATLAKPTAVSTTLTKAGEDVREDQIAKLFIPLAFMLLLWSSVWVTGNYLLTSTIEEKSNRVIEVLLSAVSPLELLTGKILGQCAVGLVMLAMYGGVGLTTATSLGYAHLVPPEKLAYLGVYFVMAFLMVAATMTAVGAAVSELRDAQTLLGPVTIVFMLPLFSWFFVSENPDSLFARVISFIPPMTPFAMILRVTSVESVPGWEILATSLVGFGGVVAMVWAAARIFRVGILLSGKPATPAEMWKWLRYE